MKHAKKKGRFMGKSWRKAAANAGESGCSTSIMDLEPEIFGFRNHGIESRTTKKSRRKNNNSSVVLLRTTSSRKSKGTNNYNVDDPPVQQDLSVTKSLLGHGNLRLSEKYKPDTFEEIVGQNIVAMSLRNSIVMQKIVSLYLFFGPRGTGKSTTARIFAAALNCSCVDGDRKPCWHCKNCLLFKAKKCPNVCEISSYDVGGLDHLKSLIRNPDLSSYKVFVVEDCHESRSEDLNLMLLECIENQHGNVVVILTTIDMELLPKSVLSRCQKFRFQKIKEPEMFSKLKNMACLENMDIEEAALRLIASRADGSLAEAENQLEQCSLISSKITVSTLSQMIGVIPSQKLVDLLFFAIAANTEKTIQLATEISDSGIKPLALVSQLAALITDILANDFSLADKRTMHNFLSRHQLSRECIVDKLGQALKVLGIAEKNMRGSNTCISGLIATLLKFGQEDQSDINHNSEFGALSIVESAKNDVKETADDINYIGVKPLNRELTTNITNHGPIVESPIKNSTFSDREQRVNVNGCKKGGEGQAESNKLSSCRIEEIWQHVLRYSHSTTLEDLLQGQGKLVSLLVRQGKATANIQFNEGDAAWKSPGIELRISQALQNVLGCPVDVDVTVSKECEDEKYKNQIRETSSCGCCRGLFRCMIFCLSWITCWRKCFCKKCQLKCRICADTSCICMPFVRCSRCVKSSLCCI